MTPRREVQSVRVRSANPSKVTSLVIAALVLTPVVLGGALLSELDLGMGPSPAAEAPLPASTTPQLDVPLEVEVFEPIELHIETNEDALRPRCNPVRAIRDGFRPKHQRCGTGIPSV